jgi:DNA (cytosine-5)-methyltransferase 3A
MNILSLFDGMSCGQIALNKLGIKYDNYFASEIDKYAIKVTQTNYSETIQLGDIRNIKVSNLPKIDLLIGGSPCQDFSIANKDRKGLAGEKSSLFFEYYRILQEVKAINPEVKFLLENVIMDKKNYNILSKYMNCYPVRINSSLVSGALRDRYYWSNINGFWQDLLNNDYTNIPQPKNKKIKLQDILEFGYSKKRKHSSLNTGSGIGGSQEYLKKRNNNTGMVTLIYNSPDFDFNKGIRTCTQLEMERLHNIPEGYTSCLNQKQAGQVIGNGWTVDVIAHIFQYLKK